MLGKQAKTLSIAQVRAVHLHLAGTRNPVRNKLIFLLSIKAGLRAKEIRGSDLANGDRFSGGSCYYNQFGRSGRQRQRRWRNRYEQRIANHFSGMAPAMLGTGR